MGTTVVRRPPRQPAPELPAGDVAVPAPPVIAEAGGSRWAQLLQFLPMLTGTIATALLFAGRSGDRYSLVIGAIFGVSTLGMLITGWSGGGGQSKRELIAARRDYLRQLGVLRGRVREAMDGQRRALHYRHPEPAQLWSMADSFRLWERRPPDADFGVVRVGLGPQELATRLVPPVTAELVELEPVTSRALRAFLDAYSVVPDLPVAVSLRAFGRVYLRGGDAARGLARAMIGQAVVGHAPADLVVAVCAAPDRRAEWEWVKWLPHALHPDRVDLAGPTRLLSTTVADLEERLSGWLRERARRSVPGDAVPHLLVLLDGGEPAGARLLATGTALDGVTVLDLDQPPPRRLDRSMIVLDVAAGRLTTTTMDDSAEVGRPDLLGPVEIEALARRLAPRRLATTDGGPEPLARRDADLAGLLGLGDPTSATLPHPARDRLRVPIGVDPDGRPVELDLKESAQDGMGPHGLVIGATGSGKSELLRTLVVGLAATHPSETLNFVLIDYKGGATFATLDRLPHVAAMITNLADELDLVDRMTDAINGEVLRRQEVLRRAGNFASVRDYERARAAGGPLAPLPTLVIVCDEFSELLTAKPDFIDLFVQIGRVGRSLAMHLLLASQRLEEGRLRGLDTHLSYRLGLRTFSALESRAVLGVPDAYELPRSPGHGYLRYGTEPLVRFTAAYVSGPIRAAAGPDGGLLPPGRRVIEYTTRDLPVPPAPQPALRPDAGPRPSCSTSWSTGWPVTACPRIRCGCRRWARRRAWTRSWARSASTRPAVSRSPTPHYAGRCGCR